MELESTRSRNAGGPQSSNIQLGGVHRKRLWLSHTSSGSNMVKERAVNGRIGWAQTGRKRKRKEIRKEKNTEI